MVEGSCCFCGWRQPPAGGWGLPEGALEGEVLGLAAAGVTRFLCGGTPGFDTLAARAVLRARAVRPEARRVLVLPCGGITWGWRPGGTWGSSWRSGTSRGVSSARGGTWWSTAAAVSAGSPQGAGAAGAGRWRPTPGAGG